LKIGANYFSKTSIVTVITPVPLFFAISMKAFLEDQYLWILQGLSVTSTITDCPFT
jgi:hypothetical protein